MRRFLTLLTIFSLLCVPLQAHAFLSDPIVSAWMPVSWDTEEARASFEDHIDLFDEISPFEYNLLDDGTIGNYKNADDPTLVTVAHRNGVRVIPTITNNFSGDKIHFVVHDSAKRAALIAALMDKIATFNYDGIDIDFEGVEKADEANFTTFMEELSTAIHDKNKILSIAIQARTVKTNADSTAWSQDWEAIGKVVDRFRIMTYDYHWQTSDAGSISPIPWIEEVATYAESRVPHDKIIMGMPFYGYNWPCAPGDWNDCNRAISVKFQQAEDWLDKYNVPLGWDDTNQEPYFTYKLPEAYGTSTETERIVYFQNAASIHSKLIALADNKVQGIAAWRLGGEDPGIYDSISLAMGTGVQPDFADVTRDHWAYLYIQPLRNRGVVQGVSGNFFPEQTISRAETVKMVMGSLQLPALNYKETPLLDVKKSGWEYPFIQTAIIRGWLTEPETGYVRPNDSITRAEAVAVLARAVNLSLNAPDSKFSDVDKTSSLALYIDAAKEAEWLNGYPDGTFKPNQPITRAEFAKVLSNARK